MPARLEIEGGIPLRGTVKVSAAKNAALPALAAALRTAEPLVFPNLPDWQDVRTMIRLLQTLGATIDRNDARASVRVARVLKDEAAYELVSTMRASVLVLGPLVARHGSARVALPGGCAIGVRPIDPHLKGVAKLDECVVGNEVGWTWLRVRGPERPRPSDVVTSPFPGFATDMQAQLMTLLGLADGQSRVTETIFENRFMHAAELVRLGARIETEGSTATIRGVRHYQGAQVMASDLRASAALVLAWLAARGRTEVARVYHLDRGYERMETKLANLGARIERRT